MYELYLTMLFLLYRIAASNKQTSG